MKEVQDRVVQFSNRYKLTNAETGEVLGTFDFDEVTGTVQQVGTEIDKELFDSIADDLAARVVSNGGELAGTIVTFSDISGTAANVASGDTSATLWGKVKNWFSRLKALAFKDKISNADVANDANIVQSKIDGLRTEQYGVQIGTSAVCSDAGAAVGNSASATTGGAVGLNAIETRGGGAVGSGASATYGAAVGSGASETSGGGAVGYNASAVGGFAGGNNAKATKNGAVQLGDGTNSNANTLQFRDYQIVDANGNIPAERLSANSPVRSVNGKTGAVSLSAEDVGAAAASDLNAYLPLTGGTLTGNLTGKYITGTWLQATAANHQTSAASKIAVFDGSGWLYYRTSAELLSDIGAATESYVNSQIAAAITTALNTAV